ncbi:MAG: ABC transporter permease [Spirochaetaceae bacterium]|nr:MAG: ABC transporter permease [Spirochaetaceae bacterium]
MKLHRIALRNVFRNGRRSVLSLTAVAVAAMSITLLFSVLAGIQDDVRHNSWNFDSGEVRIRHGMYDEYEYLNPVQYMVDDHESLVTALLDMDEVEAVSPRVSIAGVTIQNSREIASFGMGFDLERERDFQDLSSLVASGRLPEAGRNEAIVGFRLARELGIEIGDSFTVLTQTRARASNAFTLDVVGLADFPLGALSSSAYILPLDRAQHFVRSQGGVTELLVKGGGRDTEGLQAAIEERFATLGRDELNATPWTVASGGYAYLQMAGPIYSMFALVFFVLGSTVIINTTMMTVHERTREIGTLSALGMKGRDLVRLFFTEGAVLGLAGSALGVLIGAAIALVLGRVGIDFGTSMELIDMDISNVLYPAVNAGTLVFVFAYSSVIATAASFLPSRRAAKLSPVDALRG